MLFQRLPPYIVAAIRHRGPHEQSLTDATWEQLILWASPRRLLGRVPRVRAVGMLWDDPRFVPPGARRYDVAVPIDAEDVPRADAPALVMVTMPGEYLKVTHTGPYDDLPAAYDQALGADLRESGCEAVAAPFLELYRNSPSDVDPGELVTDVYIPVTRLT